MKTTAIRALSVACGLALAFGAMHSLRSDPKSGAPTASAPAHHFAVVKTDAEWRRLLTPEQYDVMRRSGTEVPFSGKYNNFYQKGVYKCAACGNELFRSDAKYDPKEGWPSFWQPASKESVITQPDKSLFMERNEVRCARCGAHLGHLFNDGPKPTGLRYCIDSAALQFVKK